ncbi:hypothetical protein FS749_016190 [Ceratobasidium sp. UAMH 11750]|nr:hypothetical protein FS749_016190 [Ceratobasidium sp. UAMH 11750]
MQTETNNAGSEGQKTRARKRQRSKREDPYPDLALQRCYFTEIPLELLANILQYVYPVDLLALSHTNSYFRQTLRDPRQNHIWKSARVRFPHATILDPIRFTEIELATLLFGTGRCSICKTGREIPLSSVLQPMRVCKNTECREEFRKFWAVPPPAPEISDLVHWTLPSQRLSLDPPTLQWWSRLAPTEQYKRSDMARILIDIEAGLGETELESKYNTTYREIKRFNKFLERISLTLNHLESTRKSRGSESQRFVKQKLANHQIRNARLDDSATYIKERRRLCRLYQTFDDEVWDSVPPRAATDNPDRPRQTIGEHIIQEMQAMEAAAQRRRSEANRRETREAVKKHWHQLKNASGSAGFIVPRLNEFNTLPVVNALLKPKAADGEADDLNTKDSTLSKLVKSDVTTWEERTSAQFRKMLQVPMPRKNHAPEPGVVPPLDRATSLFECIGCKSLELGVAQEGTLTFRSAVKHRCKNAPRKKFQWKSDLFQPDSIGIQIARHAVVSSGHVETKTTRKDMDELGPRFLCTKCPSPIYLTFGNLIGHIKRHGVSDPDGSFGYQSIPPNIDIELLSSSTGMVEARRRGAKKGYNSTPGSQDFFVCSHCNKSLLWNGLVSHVKTKHKFSDIRDEDFYPKPKSTPKHAVADSVD